MKTEQLHAWLNTESISRGNESPSMIDSQPLLILPIPAHNQFVIREITNYLKALITCVRY